MEVRQLRLSRGFRDDALTLRPAPPGGGLRTYLPEELDARRVVTRPARAYSVIPAITTPGSGLSKRVSYLWLPGTRPSPCR